MLFYSLFFVSLQMQGIKQRTSKLFYQFSLEEHVCPDHPFRRINQALDLRFLYKQTQHYYGTEGQKSIDPVVFFKICLVGYFNNIAGDRALIRFCNDSLSARWFIGYDIDQALPVHSTLSRTRALFGEQVYEKVFTSILAMCVDAALVHGARQVVDSALIKANAHIDSMQRKLILEDASEYCRQVSRQNTDEHQQSQPSIPKRSTALEAVNLPPKASHTKHKPRLSNDTHRCTSDPDARMAVKPNKPKDMYYHGQVCVDSQHGVVTAAMGDYGSRKDPQSFPELLAKACKNLAAFELHPREVLADGGYTSGDNIRLCEQADITAYIPNPSNYTPDRPGFIYHEPEDRYQCSQGEYLPYRSTEIRDNTSIRVYRTSAGQCKNCPIKPSCITSKAGYKQLKHSDGKPWYDLMHERLQTDYGMQMLVKRKTIVEPALGNLLEQNAMKKVYARGLQAANKHVLLACMSMNLKKWLKYATNTPKKKPLAAAASLWVKDLFNFKQMYGYAENMFDQIIQINLSQLITVPKSSYI